MITPEGQMFCEAATLMLLLAVPLSPSLRFIRIHHFPLPGSAFLFCRKKQGCPCCLLYLTGSSAPSVAVCSVPACGGGQEHSLLCFPAQPFQKQLDCLSVTRT